ncbi:MAG TPA: DctP family TRAP transporter solute-binding subunit [Clostridia bacterium]|nr:DctP family TRAP transporter solute-binding subunit [Clostridia bacterium]
MFKRSVSIMVLLLLIFALVSCGAPAEEKAEETSQEAVAEEEEAVEEEEEAVEVDGEVFQIKFANNGVSDMAHPQNEAMTFFKDTVEELSEGRIKVSLHIAGSLGDARTIMEGVQLGTIEMGDVENGVMSGFVPEAGIFDLPYIFDDLEHAHAVQAGEVGDYLREEYLDIGVRNLAFNDGGFRYFTTSKRALTDAESFDGMKIRVMESDIMIKTINAFGGSAVPMAFGELYTALQQGTVEGQENPLDLIYAQSYAEVQDYLSLSEHFYYPRQYIINEDFYQSLPAGLQEIIADTALEACQKQREFLVEYTKSMMGELKEQGFEVVEFDKEYFQKLSTDLWPEFYASVGNGDEELGKWLVDSVRAEVQ